MTGRQERASEDWRYIANYMSQDHEDFGGGALTHLVWHVANLVANATDDRYTLVLMRDGEVVEPIEMKYDETLPRLPTS